MGTWYEIARFDSWFERNCTNVKAIYQLNSDNTVKVENSCYLGSKNGKYKVAIGRAWSVDDQTNAKLKVSFMPNFLSILDKVFAGNYWILKIDPNYEVVLVGDPSLDYLWILARKKTIPEKTYEDYLRAAENMGFDISKLHKTIQDQ